jgi:hypothetical protein
LPLAIDWARDRFMVKFIRANVLRNTIAYVTSSIPFQAKYIKGSSLNIWSSQSEAITGWGPPYKHTIAAASSRCYWHSPQTLCLTPVSELSAEETILSFIDSQVAHYMLHLAGMLKQWNARRIELHWTKFHS